MDTFELLLAICVGLGLSAACGFRVFVPLFVIGLAAAGDHLTLASNMEWLGSPPALLALGFATGLEIAGYYVPWVDNLLDTIATPAAVIAGTMATASFITGMDPMLQWAVAIIGGGSAAAVVQVSTVTLRGLSSITTGGVGNPVVSTVEAGVSTGLSLLMIVLPAIIAAALVVLGFAVLGRFVLRRRRGLVELKVGTATSISRR